jgi:hypothetical protein
MAEDEDRYEYMVGIWRDSEPPRVELRPFKTDELQHAAQHAQQAAEQWTHVYLLRVIAGTGPAGFHLITHLASGGDLDDPAGSLEYEQFLDACAEHCRCYPDHPCAGVTAGGLCDELVHDDDSWDEDEYGDDSEDDHG